MKDLQYVEIKGWRNKNGSNVYEKYSFESNWINSNLEWLTQLNTSDEIIVNWIYKDNHIYNYYRKEHEIKGVILITIPRIRKGDNNCTSLFVIQEFEKGHCHCNKTFHWYTSPTKPNEMVFMTSDTIGDDYFQGSSNTSIEQMVTTDILKRIEELFNEKKQSCYLQYGDNKLELRLGCAVTAIPRYFNECGPTMQTDKKYYQLIYNGIKKSDACMLSEVKTIVEEMIDN
jgi:hypothetical protein